ncbi:MAG: hypothetical protein AAF639_37480, partial [Chloroflexota bacterium]
MATKKSKRVAFTFDERSLNTLEDMTEEGHFSSMADTVRESLQISRALQTQVKQGYTEIIVRNPETGDADTRLLSWCPRSHQQTVHGLRAWPRPRLFWSISPERR